MSTVQRRCHDSIRSHLVAARAARRAQSISLRRAGPGAPRRTRARCTPTGGMARGGGDLRAVVAFQAFLRQPPPRRIASAISACARTALARGSMSGRPERGPARRPAAGARIRWPAPSIGGSRAGACGHAAAHSFPAHGALARAPRNRRPNLSRCVAVFVRVRFSEDHARTTHTPDALRCASLGGRHRLRLDSRHPRARGGARLPGRPRSCRRRGAVDSPSNWHPEVGMNASAGSLTAFGLRRAWPSVPPHEAAPARAHRRWVRSDVSDATGAPGRGAAVCPR
jgi:hypothetical protein